MRKIKNLQERLHDMTRGPELEKAYREGEMHAVTVLSKAVRLLPIEVCAPAYPHTGKHIGGEENESVLKNRKARYNNSNSIKSSQTPSLKFSRKHTSVLAFVDLAADLFRVHHFLPRSGAITRNANSCMEVI